MRKTCLINQPAGIGDIFFVQKIVTHFINEGYDVIFPILDNLMFIADYIKQDHLTFVPLSSDFKYKNLFNTTKIIKGSDYIVVPIATADRIFGGSCMEAKYKLVDLDFNGWQKYFHYERNTLKENNLFYNVLGLNNDDNYSLISRRYGTQPNTAMKDVPFNKKNKIIELTFIDGYTIFDWSKVIENATEISVVDTSINYIIEKLDLRTDRLLLTSRFTPPNFSHIKNLFDKNWTLLN